MENKKQSKILIILALIVALSFLVFLVINIKKENLNLLITALLISLMSILLLIPTKKNKIYNFIALLIIGLTGFNAYTFARPINIKNETNYILNLQNKSLTDALNYAKENNINIVEKYDYSDYIAKYYIINQNIINEPLNNIKELELIISKGPNYDLTTTIPSFVGENIDELIKFINNNYLNNVEINFITNENEPNTIISQSLTGNIKRNDKLVIEVAKAEFKEIEMTNLVNKSLFEAKLWLDMNNIKYKVQYDYNEIDKNYIFKQSINENTKLTENDNVTIYVSKGKSITVPNLKEMSKEEITKWITDNNLNVEYKEDYNKEYEMGKIIDTNYKENDVIEQGTTIIITTSKGTLKMIKFTTLSDFKIWAANNNIKYDINYSFSNTVPKNGLIKSSHNEEDVIADSDTIILTISNGKAVTMPNFKGMKKSEIENKCNSLNLNCSFYYYGYTIGTEKDIAITQTINASKQVATGTYVKISLSSGIAKTFTIEINETDLVINNASKTIENLKKLFNQKYPGVIFTFTTKASNTYNNAGFIHENSNVKNGTKVVQGKTYTVTITS